MRNFILATHGNFAKGIKSSLDIIYGETDNVFCICAYMDEEVQLKSQIEETMSKLNPEKEVIFITDIFGGSVNNELLSYVSSNSIHLIAGLNLPLLIELISSSDYIEDTKLLINSAIESSKMSIQYCNETINKYSEEDDEF